MHYATAATLLFRSHDIPARFVSGYLIGKEQWKTSDDGTYQVTVTGADAMHGQKFTRVTESGSQWN